MNNTGIDYIAEAQKAGQTILDAIKQAHEVIKELRQLNKEAADNVARLKLAENQIMDKLTKNVDTLKLVKSLEAEAGKELQRLADLAVTATQAMEALDQMSLKVDRHNEIRRSIQISEMPRKGIRPI